MTDDVFESMARLRAAMERCRNIDKKLMIRLTKTSMIRSVNSSLAIEGNGLKPFEVMDVLNGRTVVAPFDELVEARNALNAYGSMDEFETWSLDGFLRAQDVMMFGLVEEPGFRNHPVGIFEGERLIYRAPDHTVIGDMMERLFEWGRDARIPIPIVAAVMHFYIESVHPFPDGNGRMGRLWNSKILHDHDLLFDSVSMESAIHARRTEYYDALMACQCSDPQDCTDFIVFCLDCLTGEFTRLEKVNEPNITRILDAMDDGPMTSSEIMGRMGLSNKSNFMKTYLEPAMESGLVIRTEDKARSRNQKYRKLVSKG